MNPSQQNGRLVGYARVITDDQDLTLQLDALVQHGVPHHLIFTDKLSGASSDRPGLRECLEAAREGDTLVVWRLDRLGRSMHHLERISKLEMAVIVILSAAKNLQFPGTIDPSLRSG